MPDKRRECWYIERLRQAIQDFPVGRIAPDESPDFIIASCSRRVGIEVTTFHLPPARGERPHQERQSLKRQVVQHAQNLHMVAAGPALYVRVHFDDSRAMRKQMVRPLGETLARAILNLRVPTSLADGWVLLPVVELAEIFVRVQVAASVDGIDRLWSAGESGWVAPVLPHHIEQVVASKRAMIEVARRKCDETWLVIVNDAFIGAAQAELSETAASQHYCHPFARLLWLEPHRPLVRPLK